MLVIEYFLEGVSIAFSVIGFLSATFTLILIGMSIRPLFSNVPILLICNTYISVAGASSMTLLMMVYGVYDNITPGISFKGYTCQLRSYMYHVFICNFYYSCILQALFRLFRVVFFKHKILQSRGVIFILMIIQWIIATSYISVYYIRGDFEYHPEIGSCWLSFERIIPLCTALIFIYLTSLSSMGIMYYFIVRHVRRTGHIQEARRQANQRDQLIVKRIIMLVVVAMTIGFPSGVTMIVYVISHYLIPLAYHLQALAVTTGLFLEPFALAFITPQVRELFKRNRRQVHPVISIENGVPGTTLTRRATAQFRLSR